MANMEFKFDGKIALVTGAGKGLGRGIAIKLAELGAKVHAISRTEADLDSLKQEVPSIEAYTLDVADWDRTREVVSGIGPVDYLVNNAGIVHFIPVLQVAKDQFDNLFDINFKAVFNISQVVANGMVERGQGGSIVIMSSIAGIKAGMYNSIYCCSKAALDMLTKTFALELGPHNIRVNSINPSLVMTPMGKAFFDTPEKQAAFKAKVPLRKMAEVDDVVSTTLFLLSDHASMISGTVLPVDGGMHGVL